MNHPPRCQAVAKLDAAQRRTGGLLSVGLEPSPEYLPAGFAPTIAGYEAALRLIIDATGDLACAFKINLAFFESLGSPGAALLERVRSAIPGDVLLIADAKRGDIGSTAKHYARALYDVLGADAATVNPLMGRDSAEPFLAYASKLTYFLGLTSNPGAADFLLPGGLYRSIASAVADWNTAGNCGLVVGATRSDHVADMRALAPSIPFLVPGVGAQGGDLEAVLRHGSISPEAPGLLIHVTRGILPAAGETGDPGAIIRQKAIQWRDRTGSGVSVEGNRR